jgi:hypothetical protein
VEGGNTAIAIDGYPQKAGSMYIYRNRAYFTQQSNAGKGVHFKGPFPDAAHCYIYHNSISGNGSSVSANDYWKGTLENPAGRSIYFINNIFSSVKFFGGSPVGQFAYNWIGGRDAYAFYARRNFSQTNIVEEGHFMWLPITQPSFRLAENSPARHRGVDLSRPSKALNFELPPLPGMEPGYFQGSAPDLGAIQNGVLRTPSAPMHLRVIRVGATHVELVWQHERGGAVAFLVDCSEDGKVFSTVGRTSAQQTSYVDVRDDLPGSTLWYRVRAADFTHGVWVSEPSHVIQVRID